MKNALVVSIVLGTYLAGCVDAGEDGDVATEASPRIALNGLSPSGFSLNITTAQLNTTNATAQASTVNGRNGLAYLVGCALTTSQSFTINVAGLPYTFYGAIGLAPAWTTRALTTSEANAISSCLYSRLNRDAITVSISVRGNNAGYATAGTEVTDYSLQEGAFWGNAFKDLGSTGGVACMGVDKVATPNAGQLQNRHCTENQTDCNMTMAGHCTDICTLANGFYTCTFNGATITDAATVYVSPIAK